MSALAIGILCAALGYCVGVAVGIMHERSKAAVKRQEVQP